MQALTTSFTKKNEILLSEFDGVILHYATFIINSEKANLRCNWFCVTKCIFILCLTA